MPPTSGITPGILVLNAVITALAAVLAVFIAQKWTTEREDRQWQRQRERDHEEREEQRRRDELTWRREDHHRFVAEKRIVYGEFLNELSEFLQQIDVALSGKHRLSFEEDADTLVGVRSTISTLKLLAPPEIVELSEKAVVELISIIGAITGRIPARPSDTTRFGEDDVKTMYRNDYALAISDLQAAMREDLGVP
jgi:hypothetical protein